MKNDNLVSWEYIIISQVIIEKKTAVQCAPFFKAVGENLDLWASFCFIRWSLLPGAPKGYLIQTILAQQIGWNYPRNPVTNSFTYQFYEKSFLKANGWLEVNKVKERCRSWNSVFCTVAYLIITHSIITMFCLVWCSCNIAIYQALSKALIYVRYVYRFDISVFFSLPRCL